MTKRHVKPVVDLLLERSQVDQTSPLVNGKHCRVWIGGRSGGYGVMAWHGMVLRVHVEAHRAWIGPLSRRKPCALHHCDIAHCIEPAHLFAGTRGDNNQDRHDKGRSRGPCGAAHGLSHLVEHEVRSIWHDKRSFAVIAAAYSTDKTNVSLIKRGVAWRHLGLGVQLHRNRPPGWPKGKPRT